MSVNLYRLKSIDYQNPNMWEFYIDDPSAPPDLKFLVTEVSLPFEKLTTETRSTGTKHYMGFEAIGDFSITFRETVNFDIYDYFNKWKNLVYDPDKRVFRSGPGKFKTGILAFQESKIFFSTAYNKVFQFNRLQIKGMEDIALNYETTDSLKVTVNFTADEVVQGDITRLGLDSIISSLGDGSKLLEGTVLKGISFGVSAAKRLLGL